MRSSVYQSVMNLIIHLPIKRCTSKFMNVTMSEHCTFDNKIFRCGKVYYSTSIIITNFVQTLIPNRWFENGSLPTLALKSPKKNFHYVI
jgi:hypothetical protein